MQFRQRTCRFRRGSDGRTQWRYEGSHFDTRRARIHETRIIKRDSVMNLNMIRIDRKFSFSLWVILNRRQFGGRLRLRLMLRMRMSQIRGHPTRIYLTGFCNCTSLSLKFHNPLLEHANILPCSHENADHGGLVVHVLEGKGHSQSLQLCFLVVSSGPFELVVIISNTLANWFFSDRVVQAIYTALSGHVVRFSNSPCGRPIPKIKSMWPCGHAQL